MKTGTFIVVESVEPMQELIVVENLIKYSKITCQNLCVLTAKTDAAVVGKIC